MAPEFAAQLAKTPENRRRGLIFRIVLSEAKASNVVSRIGKKAKIVVNRDGKYASAHDLRRSFGTRWATRVMPAELRELMRHKSIETTLKYYVQLDMEELGKKLAAASQLGDLKGDPQPKSTPSRPQPCSEATT